MSDINDGIHLGASTFQRPLEQLAEVMAQKVKREAPKVIGAPPYVAVDLHIARAAGVLLCIVTELQGHFRFDDNGARINERIHAVWNALMPVFEIKELYDERYSQLMKDKRIAP
jgi:hypothetical protein